MFNRIHNLIRPSLIAYSLLGSCFTLVSYSIPIQAKTPANSQTVAQLDIPDIQYQQYDWQNNQFSQNYERYLVIIDNNSSELLEQVRFIEPGAFRNRYQGRSVIQAGLFETFNNAEQRMKELQSNGISSRIYSQTTGREIANSNGDYYLSNSGSLVNSNTRNNNRRQKTKYYYVAIPGKAKKIVEIENKIRQSAGADLLYDKVTRRNSRLGSHIAVGPFAKRSEAEQWNSYLRSLGLNNARVYYGK